MASRGIVVLLLGLFLVRVDGQLSDISNQSELHLEDRTSMKLQIRRRLLYIEEDMQPENVCENYSIREQHNVAMVKVDFVQSGSIYTCRCFQEANFEELQLIDYKPILRGRNQDSGGSVGPSIDVVSR
ncbi:uncharacterized protein DMAD_02591 [Drosophila madeirensis]|uniref:Uncharacterized protein n=1 Tax=Drosophila madeirensis TaxID=30013 RepID=A0AAU9G719_DROMD